MPVQESMDTSFSYVELLRDPLLKRVRDVTNFCHPASKSAQAVICIQLRERGYQAVETHGAQAIFDHIVALNLISGQAKLIDSALSNYRSEEHTSELQSLMRISYAVLCLKQQKHHYHTTENHSYTY